MARLSKEKIEQIRGSVDIVDVIGSYIPLQRKGKGHWLICPFHDDSSPSMSISQELQIYKCFVCQEGGNVFTFLQNYLKISYIEAIKKVAEIGRVDVSELNNYQTKEQKPIKHLPLYRMHEETHKMYSLLLKTKDGLKAHQYLLERNITDQIIENFQIGYASKQHHLFDALKKLDFKEVDMVGSGLIIESNMNYYDRFSDRIVFPLWDSNGKVVGFSARVYHNNNLSEAKYINSPESDIFIKGDILYHYHKAKEVMRKHDFVYLLEGFMDVIALYRVGINNSVALMGTALTKNHITLLRRLTNTIHLALDGDAAGRSATLKIGEQLVESGFDVRIIKMKDDLDPDEVLEQFSSNELINILKAHVSLLEFKIDYYYKLSNMNNYDERKSYAQKITKDIALLEDKFDSHYYNELLSIKSGFKINVIEEMVNSSKQTSKPVYKIDYPIKTNNYKLVSKFENAERSLIFYMLRDKYVCDLYEAKLGFIVENQEHRIIVDYIVDYYRTNQVLEVADFVSGLENHEMINLVIDIYQSDNLPIVYDKKVIMDYIKVIISNSKVKKIEFLKDTMKNETDSIKKAEMAHEIAEISRELKEEFEGSIYG